MAYHNASIESDDSSGVSSDFLEILFVKVKKNSSILKSRDAGGILPIEIGKRLLFMFLLKSEDDPDVSTSLAALDSPVGIEMRSWWCQTIGLTLPFSRCWTWELLRVLESTRRGGC